MMYVSFSLPFRFFGMMRLPAMYFFLCGQFFSFSHSGISAMASRFLIPCLSVLAINKKFCLVTIRRFERMPTFNFVMNAREILLPIYDLRFTIDAWQGVKQRQKVY